MKLLFNIKKLCFLNPSNLKKAYKNIKKKFISDNAKHFFNYFERTWSPTSKNLLWNYFYIYNSIEFDKKFLFFTNNLAEHANKVINSTFKKKCPRFEIFEKSINLLYNQFNNQPISKRKDEISRLLIYFIKNQPDGILLSDEEIKEIKKEFFGNENHLIINPISEILGEEIKFETDNINNDINFICKDDDLLKLDNNLLEEHEFDDFIKSNISNEDSLYEIKLNEPLDLTETNNSHITVLRDFYIKELREIDLNF